MFNNKFILLIVFSVAFSLQIIFSSSSAKALDLKNERILKYNQDFSTSCGDYNKTDIQYIDVFSKKCTITFVKPFVLTAFNLSVGVTNKKDGFTVSVFDTATNQQITAVSNSWPSSFVHKPDSKSSFVLFPNGLVSTKLNLTLGVSSDTKSYSYADLSKTYIRALDFEPSLDAKSEVTYDSAKIVIDAPAYKKIRVNGEELETNVYKMTKLSPNTEYEVEIEADFEGFDTLKKTYKFKTSAKTYDGLSNVNVSDITDTSAKLTWNLPKEPYFSHVEIDGQDVGKSVNYLLKKLKPSTDYTYKVYAVYDDKKVESIIKFTTAKEVDRTPPKDVGNLRAIPDVDFVLLHWQKPVDLDYAKTYIYRNNTLIATLTNEQTYKDIKLSANTNYTYRFVTADKEGNKSEGEKVLTKTKEDLSDDVPEAPSITVKALSKGARVTFDSKKPNRIKGYNVYLIDKATNKVTFLDSILPITARASGAVNTALISAASYQVTGLTNNTAYSVYAIAVGANGLQSEQSNIVSFTPSAQEVAVVDIADGYQLSDIAAGTSTWFSGIWLILAFAIGIVLAFIVGTRLKRLFLD